MSVQVGLDVLLAYTAWERGQWHAWFQQHGAAALATTVGPHTDGRFDSVGSLVRHIFSAETRYIDRLTGRPVTDTSSVPSDDVEALFALGLRSRDGLRAFCNAFPSTALDVPRELHLGSQRFVATPRKILLHVLVHEIKHWAQVATLLRLQGLTSGFHDVLFSPVLGPGQEGGERPDPLESPGAPRLPV